MSATTTAAPQAPQSIGAFGRIIGAIANPRPTFEDITRKPSWFVPLLVLIIVQCAITVIFSQRVGWRAFMEKQIAQSPSAQRRLEQLSPEQRQQIIDRQAQFAPIFGYVGVIIGVPLVAVIIAAIFMGIFNGISGAGLDFKTSFGIISHSYMPGLIVALLGILILYIKPPDQIDLQNLVASNVGAVLSSDSPRWLQSLGTSIDIFSFWIIGLMALGYSVARPKKITMSTGLAWIIGLWVVYVLVKVGATAMFS
ncbi:MAG TPA: YIP1 family protein [Candidatus Acidoferrales bacterium]|nr:YIP1 family protein [Candidatus Acidoferrales bacterium]